MSLWSSALAKFAVWDPILDVRPAASCAIYLAIIYRAIEWCNMAWMLMMMEQGPNKRVGTCNLAAQKSIVPHLIAAPLDPFPFHHPSSITPGIDNTDRSIRPSLPKSVVLFCLGEEGGPISSKARFQIPDPDMCFGKPPFEPLSHAETYWITPSIRRGGGQPRAQGGFANEMTNVTRRWENAMPTRLKPTATLGLPYAEGKFQLPRRSQPSLVVSYLIKTIYDLPAAKGW